MKYVEEWKEKELERSLKALQDFANEYDEFMKVNEIIVEKRNRLFTYPENEREQVKKEYNEHYKQLDNFKRNNSYIYKVYYKVMYRHYQWKNTLNIAIDEATKIFKKDIDKHFDNLQLKVEKKIGKIIKINHLGGDDYQFEGTEGNCKVEVILAGGYNIQRLHTRWVIKK